MTWFAIRTMPGAQMPQREYAAETTRSRKGYRIVPSLNPNVSAVERALSEEGFAHYMPVERRVVRDRKKAHQYTTRRFALLLGYVFVENVTDWPRLEEVPGVAGIVGNKGKPMPISDLDIEMLRAAEAVAEKKCQAKLEQIREANERLTRKKAGDRFPRGSKVLVTKGLAENKIATVVGTDRNGRIKALIDVLNSIGTISLPPDHISLVDAA